MRIRTSLSLLQLMSDEREPSRDESERPIREVGGVVWDFRVLTRNVRQSISTELTHVIDRDRSHKNRVPSSNYNWTWTRDIQLHSCGYIPHDVQKRRLKGEHRLETGR
jgi:hypothetical protein